MRKVGLLTTTIATALAVAGSAQAAQVVNGDFETGNLNGWTVDSTQASNAGYWFAYTGNKAPLTGSAINSTVATPPQGNYAALSDEIGPGRHILYQDVTLPQGQPYTKLILSLWVYYKAQQGQQLTTPSPPTLDSSFAQTQEQYRIDVMKPGAAITSVDPADILLNVFQTQTGDPTDLPPEKITADLTPLAGQTVRLRFAESDNQGILNASTDDVRVNVVHDDPDVSLGTPTRDKSNGTATLPATVNGPGTLEISGDGIATATVQADNFGNFDLPVTPVDPLKTSIKKKRKGMANVTVKFTADGKSATAARRVHLRQKRR
jgi:hypothetical protein